MSLQGKLALITGSSRGIGRGIALKLADNGVTIAVHYYQNEQAADDTLAAIRKRGSDGIVVQADMSRPDQITAMLAKVKAAFGKLDCSAQAGWITGQVIYANGGASLMNPEVPTEIQLG